MSKTTSPKKKPSQSTKPKDTNKLTIEGQGISRVQAKELKQFLGDHLHETVTIKQDSSNLTISSSSEQKVSKIKLKPYLKRFLYKQNLRQKVRILTGGHNIIRLYQPGYVEEVEE